MKARRLVVALTILSLGSLALGWTHDASAQNRWRRYRNGSAAVAAGATLNVRLDSQISTEDAHNGDTWTGHVTNDVTANDGRVAIPAGSPVTGVVTDAEQGTHSTPAQLDLSVRSVTVNGRTMDLNADAPEVVAGSQRAHKIGAIAGGAAVGALLGHTVAKNNHGTLIGGLVGGAAGYGLTRHAFRTLQLKPGTVMTFTTREQMMARR